MAIAETGAIFKTLEFDGESSGNYGVYISGEAVYNAPERDVEMMSIPGRNGAFALDNGRFENIEVTYPAGIFADNEYDFAKAISDFRNFLCSKNGYCRLTDGYNPDEYRMAIYKSGLEVTPAQLKAGEFEIIFECKPQRYLMSGESAIPVTSGDTLLNPTLFDAKPMLEITGYGKMYINNAELEIVSGPIGWITVVPTTSAYTATRNFVFDDTFANTGDGIMPVRTYSAKYAGIIKVGAESGPSIVTVKAGLNPSAWGVSCSKASPVTFDFDIQSPEFPLVYGTPATYSQGIEFKVTTSDSGTAKTVTITCAYIYDGAHTVTVRQTPSMPSGYSRPSASVMLTGLQLNSSQSALGSPVYFDLDIGEAYKIENGVPVSVDNAVVMPARLPVLPKGGSVITYENTVTDFKIIPRWWKI